LNEKAFVVIELTGGFTERNVNSFTLLLNNHDLTMNLYIYKIYIRHFLLNIVMNMFCCY